MRCGSLYSMITYLPNATDFSRSDLFFNQILFLIWSRFSIVVFEWKLKIRRGNPALESVQIIFGYSHTQSNLYYALAANKVCILFFFFFSLSFFSLILNLLMKFNEMFNCLHLIWLHDIWPSDPNSPIPKSLQSKYIYFFVGWQALLENWKFVVIQCYALYLYNGQSNN